MKKKKGQNKFLHPGGTPGQNLIVKVDGGSKESPKDFGPLWAWFWLFQQLQLDLVWIVTRPRGSSKFNEVERVSGRENQLTGNLYLPTELCGSSKDPETGRLCEVRRKANADAAIEVYLSRIANSKYKNTVMNYFKGHDPFPPLQNISCIREKCKQLLK